jgi:hypothetical protein
LEDVIFSEGMEMMAPWCRLTDSNYVSFYVQGNAPGCTYLATPCWAFGAGFWGRGGGDQPRPLGFKLEWASIRNCIIPGITPGIKVENRDWKKSNANVVVVPIFWRNLVIICNHGSQLFKKPNNCLENCRV